MGLTVNHQTVNGQPSKMDNFNRQPGFTSRQMSPVKDFSQTGVKQYMLLNPGSVYIFQNKLMYENFSFDSPSF